MKKVLIYSLSIAAILLLGVLIGRGLDRGHSGNTSRVAGERLTVSVVTPRAHAVADRIDAVGSLVPREDILVMPQVDGRRVLSVHADVGDRVRPGQLLAVLDGEDLRIDLQSLRSDFERTREEYERARTLQSDQLVSREYLKQKQSLLESARASLRAAELNAGRTRVIAPAGGLVYRREASIGALADSGSPLFRLVQDGVVEMQAEVPESVAGRLRTGMTAEVRLSGSDAPMLGDIRLVAPRVDGGNRTTEVRITLPGAPIQSVGSFAEVRIDIGQVSGWVVPALALQEDSLGSFLWQVDASGRVTRAPVTVLTQTPEDVVVRESLQGRRFIARAGALLQAGDIVAVAQGPAS